MKLLNRAPLGFMQSRVMPDTFDITDIIKVGLVAYWKLEEVSGVRFDSVGANDLTDVNTVPSAAGVIGNGADITLFNLESFFLASNPTFAGAGGGDFTFAGWINFKTQLGATGILGKIAAGMNEYTLTHLTSPSRVEFSITNDGSTPQILTSTYGALNIGDWHFICATFNNTTGAMTLTVNTTTDTAPAVGPVYTGSAPFELGRNALIPSDAYFDEWGFWHRALSPAECAFLYNDRLGRTYPFDPADVGVGAFTNGFTTGFWSGP